MVGGVGGWLVGKVEENKVDQNVQCSVRKYRTKFSLENSEKVMNFAWRATYGNAPTPLKTTHLKRSDCSV